MIGIAILVIFQIVLLILGFWAIDIKLNHIRDDLERIELLAMGIANTLGVEDELGDAWPTMPDLDGGIDRFASYPVTGEPEP